MLNKGLIYKSIQGGIVMLNTQTMNLDLIRTFVIVGQSKDFSEAASKLKINKSNVSRHIKALEDLMGTKLVKKMKNYIELTDDGKILFDGYEKAYNLLFITEKSYIQNKDLNSGKISIGVSSDIEIKILNKKIGEFKEKYPDTIFKIINLPSKELYEKLSHYNIDFVIDEKIDLQKSSGIVSYDIDEEEYCIGYLNNKYKINSLEDIKDYPLILPVSTKAERKMFDDLLLKKNIDRKLSVETSNYISSLDFAINGVGIALLPKNIIKDKALNTCDAGFAKRIAISYVDENLSPSSKEFFKFFKEDIDKYK